jgi:dipeptidyl aminopeptidase/acylaminoacyl peptidase
MTSRIWRACAAIVFFTASLTAPCAFAQRVDAKSAAAPAKKSPWKPEDVIFTDSATGFRISPDGKWVVWVKGTGDKDKDARVSNLFLSSLSEKKEIQLTRGTDTVSGPRWSPSGEMIAFLSTRALPKPKPDFAPLQLWLINSRGGEAWSVTEFEKGIKAFEWIDNDTILFSAEEDASLYERNTKERKDDTTVVAAKTFAPDAQGDRRDGVVRQISFQRESAGERGFQKRFAAGYRAATAIRGEERDALRSAAADRKNDFEHAGAPYGDS